VNVGQSAVAAVGVLPLKINTSLSGCD